MDTHGQSKQRLSGGPDNRAPRFDRWHSLGETSHQIRPAVEDVARQWQASSAKFVFIYLIAIVVANLITTRFGPAASVFNAFVLIALDLTSRDRLHEAWHKQYLALKMAALIASGSALSWMLNRDSGQIALASFIAFGAAAITDTLVYQMLYKMPWRIKVNGSNLVSSAVDSLVFPTLAFGGILPLVTLGQFAAKVCGGFIWSLILGKKEP